MTSLHQGQEEPLSYLPYQPQCGVELTTLTTLGGEEAQIQGQCFLSMQVRSLIFNLHQEHLMLFNYTGVCGACVCECEHVCVSVMYICSDPLENLTNTQPKPFLYVASNNPPKRRHTSISTIITCLFLCVCEFQGGQVTCSKRRAGSGQGNKF